MKKHILKKIFLGAFISLGLISCEDRELVTIENQAAPLLLDLSSKNLILDPLFPNNPALTITWAGATYTVPTEVKYKVEISANEDFSASYELGSTTQSQNYISYTAVEINEAAKNIGFVPDISQKMFLKVTSYIGEGVFYQQSNITSLMVTPYLASPTYKYEDIYLIGNATAGGWDNLATNVNLYPMLKSTNKSVYTFTGKFTAGGFKMIKVKGDWGAQFGKGAADGQLSTDGGSSDISIATEGYYKVTIDTESLTYTIDPLTSPTSAVYNSVSIIGNNGDWNTDIELTKSTFDPHVWYLMDVTLNAGEIKFRANNAWDVSWGTNAEYFGTAVSGGANIPVSSDWKYNVYFNDATGVYTIIPIK